MCDCGWSRKHEVYVSGIEMERDVARADALEAEQATRDCEIRVRVLIKANAKLRGDVCTLDNDLRVERATVAALESKIAGLMAHAAAQARRLDVLVARLEVSE